MKILIDQNVSARLGRLLSGHETVHASRKGWVEPPNGDLLSAAEADGFQLIKRIRTAFTQVSIGGYLVIPFDHAPLIRRPQTDRSAVLL